jgi:hypothetical protein
VCCQKLKDNSVQTIENNTILIIAFLLLFPAYTASHCLHERVFMFYYMILLDAKMLPEEAHKLINLFRVLESLCHAFSFHAPFGPFNNLWCNILHIKIAQGLKRIEPGGEWHESHINESKIVTTEILLVTKLGLEELQVLNHVVFSSLLLLSLRLP